MNVQRQLIAWQSDPKRSGQSRIWPKTERARQEQQHQQQQQQQQQRQHKKTETGVPNMQRLA